MKQYDYLIVGAGLFGATFAHLMAEKGKKCLIIDRRSHIAGNIYSENMAGIQVHMYGPHIFHTDNELVWRYVNKFAEFNHFRYEPIANYRGSLYNMPFNMNTFYAMWGVNTPEEVQRILDKQCAEIKGEPQNLEEQAIKLVGRDIYEKLVKGYTEKQWGRECKLLPAFIIKRLPVRLRFDNNYFEHPYQGIPVNGYTALVQNMLEGIDVRLKCNFFENRQELENQAEKIVYTGAIDEFYDYCYGPLEYRSLRFETELLNCKSYQGVAGMNFTDNETPYTRIIEHKWFDFGKAGGNKTVITREYSEEWKLGTDPYYPVNDIKNQQIYTRYKSLTAQEKNIVFGGRLAEYQYYDMDQVIKSAMDMADGLS